MNASLFPRIGRGLFAKSLSAALVATLPACGVIKHTSRSNGTAPAATEASATVEPGANPGTPAAEKKTPDAATDSALSSQLEGINRQIASRKEYNTKLAEFITSKEAQLPAVLATDRSAGPSVQEFEVRTSVNSKVGQIDRASRSWQETIEAHKKVLAAAATDPRGAELETEINRLAEERTELLRLRARLVSINEKLAK